MNAIGAQRHAKRVLPCLVLTILVGTSALAATRTPAASRTLEPLAGGTTPKFKIAGSVEGIVPGVAKPLSLTITNPNDVAIKVKTLTARAVAVDPAHLACDPATNVKATSTLASPFKVPKKSSRTASNLMTIKLVPTAPDVCQGATFTLRYGGKAVRA